MGTARLGWATAFCAALALAACGDDDTPLPGIDAGPLVDSGLRDAAVGFDAGADAGPADAGVGDAGAGVDSGADVDAGVDAAVTDAGRLDSGATPVDAGPSRDAAGTNRCVAAGGTCVHVVPGSCPSGIYGDPMWCTSGLGVTCCLPRTAAPECRFIGTRSEGWYLPDGTRICWTFCSAGAAPTCEGVATATEGWYTTDGAACGTGRLIQLADCG